MHYSTACADALLCALFRARRSLGLGDLNLESVLLPKSTVSATIASIGDLCTSRRTLCAVIATQESDPSSSGLAVHRHRPCLMLWPFLTFASFRLMKC